MWSKSHKLQDKVGEWLEKHQEEIILALGVVLISLLSFAIGYIIAKQQMKEPIRIETPSRKILDQDSAPEFFGIYAGIACDCLFPKEPKGELVKHHNTFSTIVEKVLF